MPAAVRAILSAASVSTSDVEALRSEAGAAGDCDMVAACSLVLGEGDWDGNTDREQAARDVVDSIIPVRIAAQRRAYAASYDAAYRSDVVSAEAELARVQQLHVADVAAIDASHIARAAV